MWKNVVKGKMMHGYSFKRERPILYYISDFVCLELLLIIEVGGISHASEQQQVKDRKRDKEWKLLVFLI